MGKANVLYLNVIKTPRSLNANFGVNILSHSFLWEVHGVGGRNKTSDLLLLSYPSLYVCEYVCCAQSLSCMYLRPYGPARLLCPRGSQARILGCVAFPTPGVFLTPGIEAQFSCISCCGFFYCCATLFDYICAYTYGLMYNLPELCILPITQGSRKYDLKNLGRVKAYMEMR